LTIYLFQRQAWNDVDDIKIFSTPRKLFNSLQSSSEMSPKCGNTAIATNGDAKSENLDVEDEEKKEPENSVITSEECEDDLDGNESVFSTDDIIEKDADKMPEKGESSIVENARVVEDVKPRKSLKVQFAYVFSVILFIIAVSFMFMWSEDDRNVVPCGLVPT
jgi:hypothetical protein